MRTFEVSGIFAANGRHLVGHNAPTDVGKEARAPLRTAEPLTTQGILAAPGGPHAAVRRLSSLISISGRSAFRTYINRTA